MLRPEATQNQIVGILYVPYYTGSSRISIKRPGVPMESSKYRFCPIFLMCVANICYKLYGYIFF